MAKQKIEGNGNVQVNRVNGDLYLVQVDALDTNNPNLIECPSCWKLASHVARGCPHCGYDVREHFERLAIEAERKRLNEGAMLFGGLLVVSSVLFGVSWLPDTLKTFAAYAGMIGLVGAYACMTHAERLK